jgi:dUTP pyrophosphatase
LGQYPYGDEMKRQIEIKLLNKNASIPKYGTIDSAGVDLVACIKNERDIYPGNATLIPTGIGINMQSIPEDCVAMIFPRSGKGHREGIVLGNGTGIIDKDYQGELLVSILNRNTIQPICIRPGEKIAQLVFLPIIRAEFIAIEEFSSATERGAGGFGSTDKGVV